MIEEGAGIALDWLPYAVGRLAIAAVSVGRWKCEPWSLLFWTADYFKRPFVRSVNGRLEFTQQGTRLVGNAILILCLLALAAAAFSRFSF